MHAMREFPGRAILAVLPRRPMGRRAAHARCTIELSTPETTPAAARADAIEC
jgi:hypothetical protein